MLGLIVSILICFGVPLGGLVYLANKKDGYEKLFFIGVLTFVISQILLRLPLLGVLAEFDWFIRFQFQSPLLFLLIVGGLSAGVFEEVARYLGLRLGCKKRWRFMDAVALGLGHGGIEAILLVGLNQLILLLLYDDISSWSGEFLLAGIERVFAMTAHITFTIILLYIMKRRAWLAIVIAIVLHAIFNFITIYLATTQNLSLTYLAMGIMTFVLVGICYKLKDKFDE